MVRFRGVLVVDGMARMGSRVPVEWAIRTMDSEGGSEWRISSVSVLLYRSTKHSSRILFKPVRSWPSSLVCLECTSTSPQFG